MKLKVKSHIESIETKDLSNRRMLQKNTDLALDEIVQVAACSLGVPIAIISLIDDTRVWMIAKVGVSDLEILRQSSFSVHALKSKDVFTITDALEDDRFRNNPYVTGYPYVRFFAAAPLVTKLGQVFGTFVIIDTKPHNISIDQKLFLQKMSRIAISQIGLHYREIELNELAEIQQRERKELNRINKVQKQIIRFVEENASAMKQLSGGSEQEVGTGILTNSANILKNMAIWLKTELEDRQINYNEVSITRLVREVTSELKSDITAKGNELIFEPALAHILYTDEDILKTVLNCLIMHSNYHTEKGIIRIQIVEDKEHLLMIVSNNGTEDADLKKIDLLKWEQDAYLIENETPDHINYFFCWQLTRKLGGWMELKKGHKGNFVSITLKKDQLTNKIFRSVFG